MTQKELIEGMKKDLYEEVVFQIEIMGKTEVDEKELKKIIRNKQRAFKQLLSTMNIKKELNYSFVSIIFDIYERASNNDFKAMRIVNMYEGKTRQQAI